MRSTDRLGHVRTGYDIGAFWSVTGMASEIHQPMCYSGACRAALWLCVPSSPSLSHHRASWPWMRGRRAGYPVGFGDTCAGANLLGAIAIALTQRVKTGARGPLALSPPCCAHRDTAARTPCAGRGTLVDNSLLGAGMWAMSPYVSRIRSPKVGAACAPSARTLVTVASTATNRAAL